MAQRRSKQPDQRSLMRLELDPRGDIAYVHVALDVNVGVDHIERVGDGDEYECGIDFDADGAIVGYEFMNASRGLDLDGLPHRAEIAAFIAGVTGLHVIRKAS
jgi:uncharacterized protein YuzE